MTNSENRVALVTGGSTGLGRALAAELVADGWRLITDARNAENLERMSGELDAGERVVTISGDVTQPAHRDQLLQAVAGFGRLDLLINNASSLGPTPLPPLSRLNLAAFHEVLETNVLAPLALVQQLLPYLVASAGTVVNISSDAAVAAYPGWGGYGASKAALDHVTLTLAEENPSLHWYALDPGDMRTAMHQAAFPGEDISDRPEPESVAPLLLRLVRQRLPSGRYRTADLLSLEEEREIAR